MNGPLMHRLGATLRLIAVVVGLFLVIWTPRVIDLDATVTADERRWLSRAANFSYAVSISDWAQTFQREHPGVTVMWAGAVGLQQLLPDYTQETPGYFDWSIEEFEAWLGEHSSIEPLDILAAGRWWVVFVSSYLLATSYFGLRRLLGPSNAVLGLLFLALAPFLVAHARPLHPDSIVSTFIFVALVFFLSWLYAGRRWSDLLFSGVMMGMAWLTKVPAALLVPAGAVLIALEFWRTRRLYATPSARRARVRQLLSGYVLWGLMASLIFWLLWPAMWTNPVETLARMAREMLEYTEGHSNPNYFLGRIVEDPGPFFYPVAYLFRSTPATLIGLAVAVLGALRRVPPFDQPRVRQAAFGFSLFALLFMLGMSLPAKKFDRYDLPAHFTLEIVAALGWAMLATTAGRYWLRLRRRPADAGPGASSARRAASLPVEVAVLSAGVILLHGAFTALHAPYYLTYYNPLLGGSATAQRALFVGWGEGLDQAGLWLDQQPDDNERRAVSWYAFGPLSYYFDGEVETVIAGSGLPWLDIDFVVLYANQIQRQIPNAAAIHYFLSQDPARVISFRGLELVRIYNMHTLMDEAYANAPDPRPVLVSASWPDLRLASLAMPQRVALGSVLPIHMTFEGTNQKSLKFSARVVNEEGDLIGQTDLPVTPDVTFTVYVPPDAKPGSYALYLMIYEDETLEPVPDSYGETLLTLAPVEVYGGVAYDSAADFRTFNEEE